MLVYPRPIGELRQANANITLMVQGDMLAFHKDGEPPQLGLPDLYFVLHSSQLSNLNSDNRIGSPPATQLVANVSALYSPELHVGFTPVSYFVHFHLV